ncbi:Protein of unknown function [Sphingomonas laterariae]|uniref:DUF3168 domain-containing protein n=1 Tax=Edaphosphingomonas laterariae TaxID=861865 RepID=A0A239C8U8_9SPHN|nr:DUF3168 domain-containing protein [Sphingomonas laterariae]SNS16657.1 Protein of unknown function [Sphingomonas laterariae]
MSVLSVQAAIVSALRDGLGGAVSGVFDGPPARAAFPYAAIGGWASSDWSHKSGRGREHRFAVSIWDDGVTPARLHGLAGVAETAIEGIAGIGGLVSLTFQRSRVIRDAAGPWVAIIEYRARVLDG